MEIIKNLFIDGLNGFPVDFIPLFLFQLLCAGLLGLLIQILVNKKMNDKVIENGHLISLSIALMTAIVKYSLPFAVMGAAVLLLFLKGKEFGKVQLIATVLLAIAGVGCGVGSVVQTVLGFIVVGLVVLFTPLKK